MNDSSWDDRRLRAAFAERFGGGAPGGLDERTVDAVRSRAPRAPVRLPRVPAWAAAVAAVLIVGIGVGLATLRFRSADAPDPSSSVVPSRSPTEPSVGPSDFPAAVLGLPVIGVSEAIARRDAGPDDAEIAVRGWEPAPPPVPLSCTPPARRPTPVELQCPATFSSWLTEAPQRTWRETASGGFEGFPPAGPALQPVVGPEVPTRLQGPGPAEPSGEPRAVVLVGHFDDHRSSLCPEPEACRRAFVVDARVWVDGEPAGEEVVELVDDGIEPRLGAHEAAAAAADGLVPLVEPWIAILPARTLLDVDPRAADTPGLGGAELVWVVRQLVDEGGRIVARTRFVDDASGRVYAAGADRISAREPAPPGDGAGPPFPESIHGLPVISVEAALSVVDDPVVTDTALAVGGYILAPPQSIACEPIRTIEPVTERCPADLTWLLGEREQPWETVNGVRTAWRRPDGPVLGAIVRPDVPFELAFSDQLAQTEAVPVVVIGHFGDRNSQGVRDATDFVIDVLVWRAGASVGQETRIFDGLDPVAERRAVEAMIDAAAPATTATWASVVPGARLASIAGGFNFDELTDADALWVVRRLVTSEDNRPVVRLAFVVDGSDRVWLEDGNPGPLAPSLRASIGGGVDLAVIDWPGTVEDVRSGLPADGAPAGAVFVPGGELHPAVTLSNPDGRPHELRVDWIGGMCDSAWMLQVVDATPTIHLGHLPVGACRLGGVARSIVVTFSQPVPADAVEVLHILSGG